MQSRANSINISPVFHNHSQAGKEGAFTVMAQKPPKKGPHRMTAGCKPEPADVRARKEFEAEIAAFAEKVSNVIEKARAKMTDAEVERADREAEAILKAAATSIVKRKQHTA